MFSIRLSAIPRLERNPESVNLTLFRPNGALYHTIVLGLVDRRFFLRYLQTTHLLHLFTQCLGVIRLVTLDYQFLMTQFFADPTYPMRNILKLSLLGHHMEEREIRLSVSYDKDWHVFYQSLTTLIFFSSCLIRARFTHHVHVIHHHNWLTRSMCAL